MCGASNSKAPGDGYHYITFQQWVDPDNGEDQRIHFEIDDQANGEYDLLASCALSRTRLTVELLKDVPWHQGLARIVVDFDLPAGEFEAFAKGLQIVFRDRPQDLRTTR